MRFIFPILLLWFCWTSGFSQPNDRWSNLQAQIDTILQDGDIPGAQVALIHRDSLIWVGNFGMAHLEKNIPVTDSTYFRVGSITKSFVGLSALMLVEEGLLDLQQDLRTAAPDIAFENRWEQEHPVRLVHLLEHTTGFDDIHLSEYALNGKDLTLKEGIDFNPNSRKSRWPPGSHMQYCNAGPPLMAYVMERITGESFEDFVSRRIFEPLGMRRSSFRLTPWLEQHLAAGYSGNGKEAAYWHIGMRPAGSINSNAREMAGFVRMLLNAGSLDSVKLVDPESIQRMEIPTTTLASRLVQEEGYGLSNYTQTLHGFTFNGHGGGMDGFLANYGYNRELGLGYVTLVNGSNFYQSSQILKAVIKELTRGLDPHKDEKTLSSDLEPYEGIYRVANSRVQLSQGFQWLLGIATVKKENDTLQIKFLFQPPQELLPVRDGVLRIEAMNGFSSLVAFIETDEGTVMQIVSFPFFSNMIRTSTFGAYFPMVLAGLSLTLVFSVILFTLGWVAMWMAQNNSRTDLLLKLAPLVCLLPILTLVLAVQGMDSLSVILAKLGTLTTSSFLVYLMPILFVLLSLATLALALRDFRINGQRILTYYVLSVSLAYCLVSAYFGYWGMIGIKLWSY